MPAAVAFRPMLKKGIEEGAYSKKQVINFDKIGLYWKRRFSWTFIAEEEMTAPGFKASKDQVTLYLCDNATFIVIFIYLLSLVLFMNGVMSLGRLQNISIWPIILRSQFTIFLFMTGFLKVG